MTKPSRPALLAVVVSAALLLFALTPAAAFGARDPYVTRALDFIAARQLSSGGFGASGDADGTGLTPWAILAIAAGREKPATWDKGGNDPISYLQTVNLQNAATSSPNAPAFYAKVILAYEAADRHQLIYNAGSPRIDLLAKMLSYRDPADGHFSFATSGDRRDADVSTTTWALLALCASRQSDGNVSSARAWLAAAQNGDGGWGFQTMDDKGDRVPSSVDQTAAAIQSLVAAGASVSGTDVQQGIAYLQAAQRTDAGFGQYPSDIRSNAESTAWAIQAILAAKQQPTGAAWTKNGKSPVSYLRGMQRSDGSFAHSTSSAGKPATGQSAMLTTTQSLIALAGKPFWFTQPAKGYAPNYVPKITSFKPGNGAVFASTNDVGVTAEYTDTSGGTGINVNAVRIFVDGTNKTSKAKVSASKLSIDLVDLTYGQHAIRIRVADKAGNVRESTHTVTVSYSSSGGSGNGGTYYPPTPSSTHTPTPTTTLYPTPSTTLTPTPAPSGDGTVSGTVLTPGPSGSPAPSPSASAAAASDEGGGSSGAALGGILLAMLPLGAGLSYWLHRRQATALSGAGRGKLLPGGGTPWQRVKHRLPGTS
jgi:prenyltransferase beta subunit